jgi:WD40 repeat protein
MLVKKVCILLTIVLLSSCLTDSENSANPIDDHMINLEQQSAEFNVWAQKVKSENPQPVVSLTHSAGISSLDFSPDGNYLLSGSWDGSIKLWDINSLKLLRTIHNNNTNINSAIFSANGQYILSGSDDDATKLWDTANGNLILEMEDGYGDITSVACSTDGKYALSGSYDKTVKLWDLETGQLLRSFKGHEGNVNSVAFTNDGLYAVSASNDKTIKLWDINSGQNIRSFKGHKSEVNSVICTPDSRYLITASEEGKIIIWNISNGKKTLILNESADCLAVSEDSNYLLSGTGNDLKYWDLKTGELLKSLKGHSSPVKSVAFSPDGLLGVSGSMDKSIKIWNLSSGKLFESIDGSSNYLSSMTFSQDGESAFLWVEKNDLGDYLSSDVIIGKNSLQSWNITTGKTNKPITGNSGIVMYSDFSSNGKYSVSLSTNDIKVIDLESGQIVRNFKNDLNGIHSISISPGGDLLAVGSYKMITLLNIKDGQTLWDIHGHENIVSAIMFSPDGRSVISGSYDEKVKIWDTKSGKLQQTLLATSWIKSLDISTNGEKILAGSLNEIFIWNSSTGKIIHTAETESGWINSVTFSPNGYYALSGGSSGNISLWNVSNGKELRTMNEHSGEISSISVSPKGNFALSSSADGTQKLWKIPKGELIYTSIMSNSGEFIYWTPEGYFSGSEILAKEAISIVDGLKSYSIDQFFDTYYRPDLIKAKISGRDISEISGENSLSDSIIPPPELKIEVEGINGSFQSPDSEKNNYLINDGTVRIKITAKNQGGGIGEIRLFHNGVRVTGEIRGLGSRKELTNEDNRSEIFTIQLANGKNSLRATAFSSNRIESKAVEMSLVYNTPLKKEPVLWILAIGINEYKNARYNLNYAVNDADGFVKALRNSGETLFPEIESIILTDSEATSEGISSKLKEITSTANPEDVFIFFYAGHGIAMNEDGSDRPEFFFIPTEITQMTDKRQVWDMGLSGSDFELLISSIPARKQLIVLDACNSGAINSAFGVRGASEEIALSRLGRATGSALIAASRDDQFAQEFEALGQGALTKALLDGLQGNASLKNGQITVGSLKGYVESALPVLTEQYAGQAQYPTGFIFGQDFPIAISP